jgi:hypothetical protein
VAAAAGRLGDVGAHPVHLGQGLQRFRLMIPVPRQNSICASQAAAVKVMVGPLIATGPSEAAVRQERENIRQMLGFLYSTPNYWPSLELFGWQERGERLHQLSREGRWKEMTTLISDDMLDTFVPTASYAEIADVLKQWYASVSHWIILPMPGDRTQGREIARIVSQLHGG